MSGRSPTQRMVHGRERKRDRKESEGGQEKKSIVTGKPRPSPVPRPLKAACPLHYDRSLLNTTLYWVTEGLGLAFFCLMISSEAVN